jgi:hypothetical protein
MFSQNNDYVLTRNGRAWLVQGKKRTPFGSARMSSEFKRLTAEYPDANSNDPKIKNERKVKWAALFKKSNSGAVSPNVVSSFSKEMRLSVRQSAASSPDMKSRAQDDRRVKSRTQDDRRVSPTKKLEDKQARPGFCPDGVRPPCPPGPRLPGR